MQVLIVVLVEVDTKNYKFKVRSVSRVRTRKTAIVVVSERRRIKISRVLSLFAKFNFKKDGVGLDLNSLLRFRERELSTDCEIGVEIKREDG